jgi:8-oxo-dGTP pyrophosphatase MutT (NUDIX family)
MRSTVTEKADPSGAGGAKAFSKAAIRASLSPRASLPDDDMRWLAGATPEFRERVRALLPTHGVPAAVLVPLIERESGWTVLLTQRSAALRDHAGQISFPGGRVEAGDADAWAAALREAEEEIGLSAEKIEFAGYLPDHLIATGFRVTPVVAFVDPRYELKLDPAEVHEAFEVPLAFLFDAANHRPRQRRIGELTVETLDIPYGSRNIWGATAGMLLMLRRLLLEQRTQVPAS